MTQDEPITDVETPAVKTNCRHCGQPFDGEMPEGGDFLCPACDHYQDHMQCPCCGSQVRISLHPEMAPEAHAPARRKKEN